MMSFIVYVAILIATVFSVALEWDTLVEHPPVPYHAVQAQAPAILPQTATTEPNVRMATPEPAQPLPSAPNPPPAAPASAEQAAAAQPAVQCNVDACTAAYRSFRASDCTYQPLEGPRRLCSKGEAQADSADAHAESTIANCHIRACAEYYSSFNPTDCTYQPLDGPRRLCEK